MKVDQLMFNAGATLWYDENFRHVLEAHMNYLRTTGNVASVEVSPHKADIYRGDLFGFLNEVGIDPQYHWVIMRVNEIFSPHDFGDHITTLLVPDQQVINRVFTAYRTNNRIAA